MSDLSGEVRGAAGLARACADAAAYLRDGMPDAAQEAARVVVEVAAARTTPRATGALAASLSAVDGVVVAGVRYGVPVHARTPYVTRAVELAGPRIVAVYETDAERVLDTVERST